MKPMKKKIPQFKSEKEERDFWQAHDSTEYIDWKKAERITLANLKPSPSRPEIPQKRIPSGE